MSASIESRMEGQSEREADTHTAITTIHSTEHRSCRTVINSNTITELSDEPPSEGTWRQYCEHPLTAATTAMLNIHSSEEQQPQVTLLYDYYKPEVSGVGSPVVGGALDCKVTNGVSEGVSGAAPVEGLLFVGGTEVVKREPEDLTRRAVSPADRGALCDKRRAALLPQPPPLPPSDSPPALATAPDIKDELDHHVIKEELEHHGLKVEPGDRPRANHTLVIQAPLDSADKMSAGSYLGGFSAPSPQSSYEHVSPYLSPSSQTYSSSTSPAVRGSPAVYTVTDPYYREYYPSSEPQYTVRQEYSSADTGFVERYIRPPYKTNGVSSTLTVDLPSPADSGISADAVTPRDQPVITQTFGYEEMAQPNSILGTDLRAPAGTSPNSQRASRPWHDFTRHTEGDKIQIPKIHTDDDKIHIPKIFSQYGFKYHLETPISTSQRREDDRITYINKGQFYGITMEYIPDPEKPLKSGTVKSVVMLMFREEKTPEDEIKAWQFWHSRQHSVKQRILDVDTKNSVGLVGNIEEIAHNAIVVYWSPLDTGAKISVAIQCLSTDFSSQKGVKGPPLHIQVDTYAVLSTSQHLHHLYNPSSQPLPLHTQGLPLHIQVDTYEDPRDAATLVHRGYCQIKVFCDKGAERKTRDEERRAAKRRMVATTRKKYEDLYHQPCDRSEFYSMQDLTKPPVLFTPAEDLEKVPMEIHSFYSHDSDNGTGCSVAVAGAAVGVECSPPSNLSPTHGFPTTPGRCMSPPPHSLDPTPPAPTLVPPPPPTSNILSSTSTITQLAPLQVPPPTAVSPKANSSSYKFHYSFPQPYGDGRKELSGSLANGSLDSPMADVFSHVSKRSRLTPPLSDRVMLYVRQDGEDVYTPLHLVPPSTVGLLSAIEEKYKIPMQSIKNIYRKNKVGVVAKVDDDMLRHYCNEDLFLMEVQHRDAESFDLTLIELTGVEH
ncbi:protein grainyhead-like isoform X2 [Macrobrachium nipponense]|uniref:protein grainyhead-like isoform X2 n=1 Tax=Macrobrachium nipponense TaxID=159736 RepID=UPI0030C7C631